MSLDASMKSINLGNLLRASEGLVNWRGIVMAIASLFLAAGILTLGTYVTVNVGSGGAQAILGLVFSLVSLFVTLIGLSAVGILLLDRARGIPQRAMVDALIMAVLCLGKIIVIALLILAVVLLFMLVATIIYFICKIPGLGPLLLFLTHPILVVSAGILFFSIGFVFVPLVAPAIWDGHSIKQAIAKLIAVVKTRFILVILNFVLLWILVSIISGIVGAIVFSGFASMTGLGVMVLGSDLNVSLMHSFGGMGGFGGYDEYGGMRSAGEGYVWAATFSGMLIFIVAIAMIMQVWLMGVNLVYLSVTEGIDTSEAESMLDQQINQARDKAMEAKQKAMDAAERAKRAANHSAAAPPPAAGTCPQCHAAVTPEAVFCENCGHKLK